MITLKLILSFTFHLDYKENVVQQGVGLLLEKDEQGDVCQDAEGASGVVPMIPDLSIFLGTPSKHLGNLI